jgi:hypothetical protein
MPVMHRYGMVFIILLILLGCQNRSNEGETLRQELLEQYEERPRIIWSFEVISIVGNVQDDSITDYELLIRLDAGSDPINMSDLSFSMNDGRAVFKAAPGCSFDMLSLSDYCIDIMEGNDNILLEDSEVFRIKYRVADENALLPSGKYQFIFFIKDKRVSQAAGDAPLNYTSKKIPLWPIG